MPANLTPDYRAAEAAFRRARDPRERLDHLREMLRLIPKHKGTDHLQAEIKTRIKELTDELSGAKKTGARSGPATVIRREGAAQIALLGPPNSGKSALHARLTGSHTASEPYPFATQFPLPGMLPVEDVAIQLIDLPSLSPEHPVPWIGNAVQPADGCLLVIDLGHAGCVEEVVTAHGILEERRVHLTSVWPSHESGPDSAPDHDDPFGIVLPTLIVATKADEIPQAEDELVVFRQLTGYPYPSLIASSVSGTGLDEIGPWLFASLGVVRVYTKIPGQAPDMSRPFTIRTGQTVLDVATLVHKDVAAAFRYARLWGHGNFEGQQVGRDHVLHDGDIIEIH